MSSAEGYAEVFAYLLNDRDDVRKMVVRGLAEQSKDNDELFAFLSSPTHGPRSIDALLQYLHAGGVSLLGDILTILINCSAEGGCTEMLVTRKVVRKAMRLLDGVDNSEHSASLRRGLQEMTLMLLNNLTASHISAVDDLLQMEDEDMRGFYVGKLQLFYTRCEETELEQNRERPTNKEQNNNNNNTNTTTTSDLDEPNDNRVVEETSDSERPSSSSSSPVATAAAVAAAGGGGRDLRRWILHILLNLTRSSDGQALLLEDEEWVRALTEALGAPNPRHRLLAAQCYRNCVFENERHNALIAGRCIRVCVERLCDGSETEAQEAEMLLAEIVAGVMQSEEGIAYLEEINAKKHFQVAIAGNKMGTETAEFLTRHVLPLLDDLVDAYVVPGSDQVD